MTNSQDVEILLKSKLPDDIKMINSCVCSDNDMKENTKSCFAVFGNPIIINLLKDNIKWVITEGTNIDGTVIEYSFGTIQGTDINISVVSSKKVPKEEGIKIMEYQTGVPYTRFIDLNK